MHVFRPWDPKNLEASKAVDVTYINSGITLLELMTLLIFCHAVVLYKLTINSSTLTYCEFNFLLPFNFIKQYENTILKDVSLYYWIGLKEFFDLHQYLHFQFCKFNIEFINHKSRTRSVCWNSDKAYVSHFFFFC